MRRLWRDYSLSITLAVLWLTCWAVQTLSGWMEFAGEQAEHGLPAELGAYGWVWLRTTFENNSSEFLQLFMMVVLTSFLFHRGSGEGKQNQEQADRIERALQEVRALQGRTHRQMVRMEQDERNRRILEREHADHPFKQASSGDDGPDAACAECVLPRRQHDESSTEHPS